LGCGHGIVRSKHSIVGSGLSTDFSSAVAAIALSAALRAFQNPSKSSGAGMEGAIVSGATMTPARPGWSLAAVPSADASQTYQPAASGVKRTFSVAPSRAVWSAADFSNPSRWMVTWTFSISSGSTPPIVKTTSVPSG
jgi:hypothetical protein